MFQKLEIPRIGLRQRQKTFTRNRIISAARELFMERGVRRTTIGDISKAAGMSRATFYAHFPSKETVAEELWADLWRDLSALNGIFGAMDDWSKASILRWLYQVSEVWKKHARKLAVILDDPTMNFCSDLNARLENEVLNLIANRRKWRHFSAEEAKRRCYLLLLQLEQCMSAAHFASHQAELDALLESLADIWLHTIAWRTHVLPEAVAAE